MVYIEFFDKAPIKNICSCLTATPEKVYLLGGNGKLLQKHAERYRRVFLNRGKSIDFIPRAVNKNNLSALVNAISEIVLTEPECCFDLTGGDELFLVAMGIVYNKYPEKNIQMHRFNVTNNTLSDCDGDGNVNISHNPPLLTVKENIELSGGNVIFKKEERGGTPLWNMTDDFKRDIKNMWSICKKQKSNIWNKQISVFSAVNKFAPLNSLSATAPISEIKPFLKRLSPAKTDSIFYPLNLLGLAKTKITKSTFSVTYKNHQVKECLSTPGLVLEMIVYLYALEVTDKKGIKIYNDALNGVYIDWNEKSHNDVQRNDTINEIDVIMMRGMIPVFVSCKNGKIEKDELYKLNSVASKFGRDRSKKVLVATSLDDDKCSDYLRQRAKDMEINLIEPQKMSDDKFKRLLGNAWRW